jgi:hypothetical protein
MLVGHDFHQAERNGWGFGGGLALSPEAEGLDTPESGGGADDSLEDAARREREDMRERLRAELNRDPTEEELNDWLRRHTEGY